MCIFIKFTDNLDFFYIFNGRKLQNHTNKGLFYLDMKRRLNNLKK